MVTAVRPGCQPCYTSIESVHPITKLFHRAITPFAGYVLTLCVFRDAAMQGRFSQWVVAPIARGCMNLWMRLQGVPTLDSLDPVRLKKSADFLAEFGEIRTAITKDGTILKWALYTPQKFQQWLNDHGGVRDGEWIRPRTLEDWARLQTLRNFKLFKEEGRAFRVPALMPNADKKCVLRCHGFGRLMPLDRSSIGIHLAAGFNYAIFDWRKDISAKGFFQDAETIYHELTKLGFTAKQIKPIGFCRASFVVGHLKELFHRDGLDVTMVHTPPSLRSTIEGMPWPGNAIGLLGLSAIEQEGAHFDNVRRLSALPKGDAATCLIMSEGDETLPKNAIPILTQAAKKAGPCELIIDPKVPGSGDPHFGDPLHNPAVRQRYFSFLTR